MRIDAVASGTDAGDEQPDASAVLMPVPETGAGVKVGPEGDLARSDPSAWAGRIPAAGATIGSGQSRLLVVGRAASVPSGSALTLPRPTITYTQASRTHRVTASSEVIFSRIDCGDLPPDLASDS